MTTTTTTHHTKPDKSTAAGSIKVQSALMRTLDHHHQQQQHHIIAKESSSSSSSSTKLTTTTTLSSEKLVAEENGRERLKRHRCEVAGRVWIPDMWGQEELLKDWIDCAAFDESLVPSGIMSARAALAEEGRRASSGVLRIENRC